MATQWYDREKVEHNTWQALKTTTGLTYYYNRDTKEVTWDCPPELATTGGVDTGNWFWIPDSTELFVPAKKIGPTAFETESGVTTSINKKTQDNFVFPLKHSSLDRTVEDLVLLDDLHPPLILHNLKKRFESDYIYTEIGSIMIAINPYCPFPLYSPEVADDYQRALRNYEPKKPHVFKVADAAFRSLFFKKSSSGDKVNQSIIISGDSGSGKTEATKHCLRYLARISSTKLETSSISSSSSDSMMTGNIEEKILMTNPVLEGFGNAKTIRNDNSSRFGKYIRIYFNENTSIMGAKIESYLLEKIRVVDQAKNERNYHIFYQLLSNRSNKTKRRKSLASDVIAGKGGSEQTAAVQNIKSTLMRDTQLDGKTTDDFEYLSKSKCTNVENIDDEAEFEEMIRAFLLLELKDKEITEIFQIVSAVMYLGNIGFKEEANDSCSLLSKSGTKEAITKAAQLLKVDEKGLKLALTKKISKVSGEDIIGDIRIDNAYKVRNAISKTIYSRLFTHIVKIVNDSLEVKNGNKTGNYNSIGILDIFGFEIFKKNSLEQLCINYTNERLQQLFNLTTFKLEEELYAREGIVFESVCHWDNAQVIESIGGRKNSVFFLVDEELKIPGGNTKDLIDKIRSLSKKEMKNGNEIIHGGLDKMKVTHYAGPVDYDPSEFLEKNNDTLMPNLVELLSKAKGVVSKFFKEDASLLSKGALRLKKSVVKRFNSELNNLMTNLSSTGTHYIRCIKPNDVKKPGIFTSRRSYEQLLYAGVFEAVKIRKTGYPFNMPLTEFNERYGPLFELSGSGKTMTKDIVKSFKLNKENVKIGKTKIFYRSGEFRTMELKWSIFTEKSRINDVLKRLCKEIENNNEQDDRQLEELVRYIIRAEELNVDNKYTKMADKIYEKAVESRMDSKTKELINQALSCKDEDFIAKVLNKIEKKRYRTRKCMKLKVIYTKLCSANRALKRGIRLVKQSVLEEGLEKAKEVPLSASESKLVADAVLYLENIKYIDQVLSGIFGSGNTDIINTKELSPIIERAKSINYFSDNVIRTQVYLDRMKNIEQAAKEAIELLQEDEMETIVQASTEARYTSTLVKKLKSKLNMSKNELRKEQLRISSKNNDPERVFWLTVSIKNEVLQMHKLQFELPNFPALIGAEAFSKYQFFGRGELFDTYLKWTKKAIPHALTDVRSTVTNPDEAVDKIKAKNDKEMKKKLNKLSIRIFKFIQILMGDKSPSKKNTLENCMTLILSAGVSYVALRDEILCQILKQLNGNPSQESTAKGIELLKICISSFPPSEEFQSFLESYILCKMTGIAKMTFLYILHYKCYHAEIVQKTPRSQQRLKMPSVAEIESAKKSEYNHDIQEPIPHLHKTTLKHIEKALEQLVQSHIQKHKHKNGVEDETSGIESTGDLPPPPTKDEVANSIAVPDLGADDQDDAEVPDINQYLDSDDENNEGDDDMPPPI